MGFPIELRGESLELLAQHALHWPARKTLIVADLHWGKSETFRASGIPIPDGLIDDELSRLTETLRAARATRLLVLGDLVHGRRGLVPALREKIARWRAGFPGELVGIRGNHDRSWRETPPEWGITWRGPLDEEPFHFDHEPVVDAARFTWAGHLHPTFRIRAGSDSLRLPCFHLGPTLGVLPAFSRFTRGVVMDQGPADRVFVIAGEKVLEATRRRCVESGGRALHRPEAG